MKAFNTHICRIVLLASFWLFLVTGCQGQAVTILHRFGDGTVANDGLIPSSLVLGFDGNYYGTTSVGGINGWGTFFRMSPQGLVTILYNFGSVTNDCHEPGSGLIEATDGNFYGTSACANYHLMGPMVG